jgi:DNA-binding transcriptional ArsR family regulator
MSHVSLAQLAALLADNTRAHFCTALLDGRAWTAGELAKHAGVAKSTASEHLSLLVNGGLLSEERQGRHRYVRLATPETAHLIEELVAYTDPPAPTVSSLRESTVAAALARARTCYDHLAGAFGVRLKQAMEEENVLSGLAVTPHGEQWFSGLGISLVPQGRRPIVRECLDWTERRPHLAGLAGSALCGRFFELGWIERIGSGRAIRVTSAGERGLANVLRASL